MVHDSFVMAVESVAEGEGPAAPVLAHIDDLSLRDGTVDGVVMLSASDANHDPLEFIASAQSMEYHIAHLYELKSAGGSEFLNWMGRNEKWLVGNLGWFYIEPDGKLFRWGGGGTHADFQVAALTPVVYSDTSRLLNAPPNQAPSQILLVGNRLTIDPRNDFFGSFFVTSSVSDGLFSDSQTFRVNVQQTAADSQIPSVVFTEPAPAEIVNRSSIHIDVTFSEPVIGVDTSDLILTGPGAGAAVKGTPYRLIDNTWRFPVSGLRDGSVIVNLASDPNDIQDLAGNDLERTTWSHVIRLDSASTSPTLAPIPNQTVDNHKSNVVVTLSAMDPNADQVTFSANVLSIEQYLDQTIGLIPSQEFYNYSGWNEKWIRSEDDWYYILPDGRLFRAANNFNAVPSTDLLIERLPSDDYADPSRLHSPQSNLPIASWSVDGNDLTINPNNGYAGRFMVDVRASDGQSSDSQAFLVTVLNLPGDIEPPSILSKSPAPGTSVAGNWMNMDFTFSEPVFGLDSSDLVVTGPGALQATVAEPSRLAGNTWRFVVSNLNNGPIQVQFAPDENGVEDAVGNDLAASTWDLNIIYSNLLFQFSPAAISFTAANLVLSFESPSRFRKSFGVDDVVAPAGGTVQHAEVRQRGDVAQFGATGYLAFDPEDRPSLAHDWTIFARFKELKHQAAWNTLFRGGIDQQLVVHPQTRELGYLDVDGGRGFVGTGYIAAVFDDTRWHSVAATRSGARIDYYVDGLIVGSVTDTTMDRLNYLGGGFGETFATYLDDFRYFDRSLT
ncbi:MAG: LamG-like jellyroll fold domain-containing protein, partial [Pirellula sp.]